MKQRIDGAIQEAGGKKQESRKKQGQDKYPTHVVSNL
jgi:hypothetical protein